MSPLSAHNLYSLSASDQRAIESGTPEERREVLRMRRVTAATEAVEQDVERRGSLGRWLIWLMVACVVAVTVFTAASGFVYTPGAGLSYQVVPAVYLGAFGFYTASVVAAALAVVRYTFPSE